ncbi:hypothetical protein Q31b_02050 [Novipirellula aureliae]|uniref:Tetratricopeptide repeat protein n=1 Tax=Novipirellula aureliae TaxID=2527966 RepID=A0A5C6E8X2_9BACT|nr:hypothetical protein [Novipirellula aureliae]TWU45034.1 hypothetical protein Q31b_02050 [Novipirellula aureliae]
MKKLFLVMASIATCSVWLAGGAASSPAQSVVMQSASPQSEVLAEMYGQGVHAYYAGRYQDADEFLSMAINNGLKDPRAFYFRGIVAVANGNSSSAEADWVQGAQIEAATGNALAIGRALSRFQGPERMKLEEIRQKARLQALAVAHARSQQRYGEIESAGRAPGSTTRPDNAIQPPQMPAEDDNPFLNDDLDVVSGEPKLESDDAFADAAKGDPAATNPIADNAPTDSGAADGGADPFGGGGAADPFGGGGAADPFGGGGADPFGGDPF